MINSQYFNSGLNLAMIPTRKVPNGTRFGLSQLFRTTLLYFLAVMLFRYCLLALEENF